MKSLVRHIRNDGCHYDALLFICPGCRMFSELATGLQLVPINNVDKIPSWQWNGSHELPTLYPSILIDKDGPSRRCHSFLVDGVFEFLDDCSHDLVGLKVPMPDLPSWLKEKI